MGVCICHACMLCVHEACGWHSGWRDIVHSNNCSCVFYRTLTKDQGTLEGDGMSLRKVGMEGMEQGREGGMEKGLEEEEGWKV